MPNPSASSKIFFLTFKIFWQRSIFLNVLKYFWPCSNMKIYKVKYHFWPWSKKIERVQKILNKVKKIWAWSTYFWTSRWNRHTFSNFLLFFILGQSSVASFYLPQDIGGIAYFELPLSIMGNNIKSYGGYLSYILNYRGQGQGPNNSPDIIIIVSYFAHKYWTAHHMFSRKNENQFRIFIIFAINRNGWRKKNVRKQGLLWLVKKNGSILNRE